MSPPGTRRGSNLSRQFPKAKEKANLAGRGLCQEPVRGDGTTAGAMGERRGRSRREGGQGLRHNQRTPRPWGAWCWRRGMQGVTPRRGTGLLPRRIGEWHDPVSVKRRARDTSFLLRRDRQPSSEGTKRTCCSDLGWLPSPVCPILIIFPNLISCDVILTLRFDHLLFTFTEVRK